MSTDSSISMRLIPGTAGDDREFDFAQRDFTRVKQLIHQRAGISLNDSKHNMVYSRLSRRLRALGDSNFTVYLDRLERGGDDEEWQAFVNALTTNLTAFFREQHHFPILSEHLKRVCKLHRAALWCSAASTGEEPYSMAITAMEAFGTSAPPVRIFATDIDTAVLETARAGVYPDTAVARMDPALVKRYFLKGEGGSAGFVKVRPEVQALVSFAQLNLLSSAWPVPRDLDAIFCRNVMIYFDQPTQKSILHRFAPLLNAEGLLFAGHSENFTHSRELFHPMGHTVYGLARQRDSRAAA